MRSFLKKLVGRGRGGRSGRQGYCDRVEASLRDWDALFDYRARAPHAIDMHPTDEHLLPWYVAAGAGGHTRSASCST